MPPVDDFDAEIAAGVLTLALGEQGWEGAQVLVRQLARVDRLAGGMSASARPARARLRAACERAWRKRWFWAE